MKRPPPSGRLRIGITHAAFALLAAPLAVAQSPIDAAVQISAVAASSPPTITLNWPANAAATSYQLGRRAPGTISYTGTTTLPGTATGWTDTAVAVGERYEYRVFKFGGSALGRGFITAGIEATPIESRGKLVLVIDSTKAAPLATRIDRLIEDLTGDGWQVLRHDVDPTDSVPSVKARIRTEYLADPTAVRAVFLFGDVPVPYSGNIAPDGHGNHVGAWAADAFYGDMDGTWTDTSINNTTASRSANHNIPGDGKFDQSVIPSLMELAVGRVDLANMPAFGSSEVDLLRGYLDKDHDYRHKVFTVDQRAVIDDHFGFFSGEAFAATGWRNFSALVGAANVMSGDYFTTLNTTSGAGYVWSYGCGGGSYTSANGIGNTTNFTTSTNRNVFTVLFGSYFGDWDSTNNFLRAPLCSGWTLSNAWGGRPHWSFHSMGMGETLGFSTVVSQNDTVAGGNSARRVHMALMGDPTLRQHVIAPPSQVAVATAGSAATLSWTASSDVVAGYHVYRSANATGPYTRLTTSLVVGSSFSDPTPAVGFATYMVRALRLETVPTGSYWNLSQGAFETDCVPQVAAAHTNYGSGCFATSAPALLLGAAPPPVSTPTTGTMVTYTVANIPETSPGSGARFGFVFLSLSPDLAGTSLASFGAPGCSLYVASTDLWLFLSGTGPSQTTQFNIPPGVPCGLPLYATSAAVVDPVGQNTLGAITSDGVESVIGSF